MSRGWMMYWASVVLAICCLVVAGNRFVKARSRAQAAHADLVSCQPMLDQIPILRDLAAHAATGEVSAARFQESATDAAEAAGLAREAVQVTSGSSPEAEASLKVSLQQVTLQQSMTFLHHLEARHAALRSHELTFEPAKDGAWNVRISFDPGLSK